MTRAYEIIEHGYAVVIIGAGVRELPAALGMVSSGLSTACVTKVFATRAIELKHTLAWLDDDGRVRLDYRPIVQPLSNGRYQSIIALSSGKAHLRNRHERIGDGERAQPGRRSAARTGLDGVAWW